MPTRTICIAIAEVIEGGTKQEFYSDLRALLDLSRRAANIASSECLKQDDLSQSKAGKIYTYPIIAPMFSGLSRIASSIARAVESSYRQDRWEMVRGTRTVRQYRSFPVPLQSNRSVSMIKVIEEAEFVTAKIRLARGWWTVRMAGGSSYRDQIRGLRTAMGLSGIGDSKIWIDRKGKAVIGFSCKLPVSNRDNLSGEMIVSSSRDHLLVASLSRSPVPFVINADICKQWQSESGFRYQRLRQDRKSDANRRRIRKEMASIASKMKSRMGTLCHEIASRIVNKAIRSKVATINLNLTIKSYVDNFPWHDLASKIKYKAEDAGINVIESTMQVTEPDVAKPHVYFKYSPTTGKIKIGETGRTDGGRHGAETDSPEDLVIIAIDPQPKSKTKAREKYWHSYFAAHLDTSRERVREWFHAGPILAHLRDMRWIGNAGNFSQIAQVLPATNLAGVTASSTPAVSALDSIGIHGCSHNADNKLGYVQSNAPAPVVPETCFSR